MRGDRKRCAVSMRPASSVAGRRATSRAPRRRTITVSCWSTTRSRTLAKFSRRLVYVVSLGMRHPIDIVQHSCTEADRHWLRHQVRVRRPSLLPEADLRGVIREMTESASQNANNQQVLRHIYPHVSSMTTSSAFPCKIRGVRSDHRHRHAGRPRRGVATARFEPRPGMGEDT